MEQKSTTDNSSLGHKGRRKVYFNDPQRLTQLIGAKVTVVIAGRRTGKTDSIAGPWMLRNITRMPGSTGGIVVPTFKHGLTNTIPGLLAAFKRWGYVEGVHYVIGKKPPKNFRLPVIDPKVWDHVILFWNGSCAILLSQDLPAAANSLTLSWLLIDEARFVDYAKLSQETFPANGGIKTAFDSHSCSHSMLILSDMPQSQRGSWFLKYREKMDPEVIEMIKAAVARIYELRMKCLDFRKRGQRPPEELRKERRWWDRKLNQLRSVATYYVEYSSIENLQLIGEEYIRQMRRDLTPKTFQTSILSRRLGVAKDGYYSMFRESHKYSASDFAYLEERFAQGEFSADCRADADLDPDAPICIGMDYNSNINCLVAGQPSGRRLRVLKSFFVKFDYKIPALIEEFCEYYSYHRNKRVIFYHDSTARGSNYAVDNRDFRWWVVHEFESRGWSVEEVYLGHPMPHSQKYTFVNSALAGKYRLVPMFNRENNVDLIEAMLTAQVSNGRLGFRKFKDGEKAAESEENLLEHRTDITDAFDTLLIGCVTAPWEGDFFSISGVV